MNIKYNLALIMLIATTSLFAKELVMVYSQRHYDTDQTLYESFTEKTGIEVKVVKAKANELIARLESEGDNSPADILITSDGGNLYIAKQKGLLQSINSKYINESVPNKLKDEDNQWFAITKRARVIAYVKDRINPNDLSTYEDLANPKWKGRIMVRSSKNVYNQSLLASIIENDGEQKAREWAKGIKENMTRRPRGDDRFQIKAIANGVGDVALVNTYYVGKMLGGTKAEEIDAAKKVGIFFPNQNDRGTHVDISGAGITKSSKNKENAIKFLEFLLSPESQKAFAEQNYEYPVLKGIEPSKVVKNWGEFKEDSLPIYKFGVNNAKAVMMFDEVGWK